MDDFIGLLPEDDYCGLGISSYFSTENTDYIWYSTACADNQHSICMDADCTCECNHLGR